MATKTDTAVLKEFFFVGAPIKGIAKEMKALSPEERAALAEGIRNDTLTY